MWDTYLWQVKIKKQEKIKLLLHVCCAPDLVIPLIQLKNYFKLYLYWYNPNIQPFSEYKKRFQEYIKLLHLEKWDYKIINSQYSPKEFYNKLFNYRQIIWINDNNYKKVIKNFSQMNENSIRCELCYYIRLLKSAEISKKYNIPYFTTTLLISPKKSIDKLNKYWKIISKEIWVKYISFSFRKNNWFQKAVEYTKKNNIRRQNYCWCAWSIQKKLSW